MRKKVLLTSVVVLLLITSGCQMLQSPFGNDPSARIDAVVVFNGPDVPRNVTIEAYRDGTLINTSTVTIDSARGDAGYKASWYEDGNYTLVTRRPSGITETEVFTDDECYDPLIYLRDDETVINPSKATRVDHDCNPI